MCFQQRKIPVVSIDRKLILANAPSNTGEQISINHDNCEAGVDRKKRLYIKRTEKGLVAYCHHCNQKGFVGNNNAEGATARRAAWLHTTTTQPPDKQPLPTLTDLSTEGKTWLLKYFCDPNEKYFSGVRYNSKQVALDIMDEEQDIIGYQVRNLDVTSNKPKYSTHFFSTKTVAAASWFFTASKVLVITEDYLSAYRVNRDLGVCSVALMRTSLSDSLMFKFLELGFEKFYIWLDPDQAGKQGAQKIKQKLKYFLPHSAFVCNISADKEPKELTPKELHGLFSLVPVC